MDFPRFVFRHGGPNVTKHGSYSERLARDAAEFEAALAEGWSDDLQAAIDNAVPQVSQPLLGSAPDEAADTSPPTRAELEQKAHELGIHFDGRWRDKRLALAIEEKLKAA